MWGGRGFFWDDELAVVSSFLFFFCLYLFLLFLLLASAENGERMAREGMERWECELESRVPGFKGRRGEERRGVRRGREGKGVISWFWACLERDGRRELGMGE